MARKKVVVVGLLGTTLDAGKGPKRWEHWRPTVAVCQHEDLIVDRLVLLHDRGHLSQTQIIAEDIGHVSPETEIQLQPFEVDDPWDFEQVYGSLLDFARSYSFVPEREEYLIHITTGTHVAQICLFLLTEARYLPARLLQTAPPHGPDKNSAGSYSVIDLDLSRYDRIASRFQKEQREGLAFLKAGIATRDRNFNLLIERIEHVAIGSTAPVLLMGPTGAGKTLLARRIYELKKGRRLVAGDFVEVNCATLRGDQAMSTLFGHVRGAFTGAVSDRPGLLKKAHGGLLFLDEVGELGSDEQAMLLRAIEHKVFYPVGSDKEVRSDFQLIAGTNRDLRAAAKTGRFRTDLLSRIDLWAFDLPGLRGRTDDLEPNLDFELQEASRILGRNVTINREARDAFLRFGASPRAVWTGNFRDLNAAVLRMATLADGARIATAHVKEEIGRLEASWRTAQPEEDEGLVSRVLGADRARDLDRFDRVQLEDVLSVCRVAPTLSAAGRTLFDRSRERRSSTNDADRLRKYLARFGMDLAQVRERLAVD